MDTIAVILILLSAALSAAVLVRMEQMKRDAENAPDETGRAIRDAFQSYSEGVWRNMRDASDLQNERLEELDKKFRMLEMTNEQKLDNIRTMMAQQMN